MLTTQPEFAVKFRIGGRQHAALAGRDDLARMEGEAGNSSVGLANRLPFSIEPDLASRGASGIFDQGNVMTTCHRHKRMQVARHSHLVNCENGARAIGYGFVHMLRIEIVGRRIDVHENRSCTTIPNGVGRRDE